MEKSLKEVIYESLKNSGAHRPGVIFKIESEKLGIPIEVYERLFNQLIEEGYFSRPNRTKDGCVVTIE